MPVSPVLLTPDQLSTIRAAPVLIQLSKTAHPPFVLYDWDPAERETILKAASRPRFTEFWYEDSLVCRRRRALLRLCGRPARDRDFSYYSGSEPTRLTRFDAAIVWTKSQRTSSRTGSLPFAVALSLTTFIVRCCARFVNRASSQRRHTPHVRPTYDRVRIL